MAITKNTKPTPTKSVVAVDTSSFFNRHKAAIIYGMIGLLAGVFWLIAMRFFLVKVPETHYHANIAVYIDGVREEFKDFTYYEEIAACSTEYADNPKGRTHLHEQVNDVIHVHDQRVTYGNFFQNIGWNVGPSLIASRTTVYQTGNGKLVKFVLNGTEVSNIMNIVIGSNDRLLVSFGDSTTDFVTQFESVSESATEVNGKQDPASCSGLNGAKSASFKERLKRATFWP
jgi:hypothetical protein